MKVALVNLNFRDRDPPLGLAYLSSYAKKYGGYREIFIVDEAEPINKLEAIKPDIIGIGSFSMNFKAANDFAFQLKQRMNVPMIIGSHHITQFPQHLLKSNFDIGVLGEGEETFLEILGACERDGCSSMGSLEKIKGVAFKTKEGGLRITERRPLIEPLDKIPFPDRDSLKMKEHYITLRRGIFEELGVYAQILTSRGCPYKCRFCASTEFWKRPRFHSAEYVVEEMKLLLENYKTDGIIIWDDLFLADYSRLKKIKDMMIREGLNRELKLSVFGRANLINDDAVKTLKEMNVRSIDFGLESGSDNVLSYLKRGTVTVEQNKNAIRLCKQGGIRTVATFIIGSPEETIDDIEKTKQLIMDPNLDEAHVFQLIPLPGTEVWDYAKRKGIVSDDFDFDFNKLNVSSGKFAPDMIINENFTKETFKKELDDIGKITLGKNRKIVLRNIKASHLKYILSPRFMSKFITNWGEMKIYLKNLKIW